MGIEERLDALKASIDANTAALLKGGGTAAPGKPSTTKTDEKVTQEQVNAALIKIKDDFGMPEAKALIKEHAKVEKMADIKPANYKAVFDAAVARHAELSSAKPNDDI